MIFSKKIKNKKFKNLKSWQNKFDFTKELEFLKEKNSNFLVILNYDKNNDSQKSHKKFMKNEFL